MPRSTPSRPGLPTAQRLAFVTDRDGNREIYVMNANGSDPSNLTASAVDEQQPAWSPDGDELAFTSEGSIYVIPVDGPGRRLLTTGGRPNWSPDGSKLAFDDPDALSCSRSMSSTPTDLGRTQLTSGFCDGGSATMNTDPVWSPEGRQGEGEDAVEEIAFVSSTCSFRGCELPEIEVLNTVSRLSRFLVQGTGPDWQPVPPNRPPECSGGPCHAQRPPAGESQARAGDACGCDRPRRRCGGSSGDRRDPGRAGRRPARCRARSGRRSGPVTRRARSAR